MIDIWPIFIRHPEAAIASECKTFSVDGNIPTARTRAPKTVTCECGNRQDREAGIGDGPEDIGVETGCRGAIGSCEENGVFVGDLEVGSGWFCERSVGRGRQGDGKLVDPVLVVEGSFRIPDFAVSNSCISNRLHQQHTTLCREQPIASQCSSHSGICSRTFDR